MAKLPVPVADTIRVAVDVSKGIAVHATGNPAKIVAVGAAAGIVLVSVAVGYGGYLTAKAGAEKFKNWRAGRATGEA